jgi:hypothetical protein
VSGTDGRFSLALAPGSSETKTCTTASPGPPPAAPSPPPSAPPPRSARPGRCGHSSAPTRRPHTAARPRRAGGTTTRRTAPWPPCRASHRRSIAVVTPLSGNLSKPRTPKTGTLPFPRAAYRLPEVLEASTVTTPSGHTSTLVTVWPVHGMPSSEIARCGEVLGPRRSETSMRKAIGAIGTPVSPIQVPGDRSQHGHRHQQRRRKPGRVVYA